MILVNALKLSFFKFLLGYYLLGFIWLLWAELLRDTFSIL